MRSQDMRGDRRDAGRAFELYLRSGIILSPAAMEPGPISLKFNPNHDPRDGRFTFAANAGPSRSGAFRGGGGSFGGAGATGRADRGPSPFSPEHPKNHTLYMVKRGDSLAKIAAQRNGLSVPDLARLNRVTPQNPLRVGQSLKLPKQSYLDAGRAAKNKLIAVADALRPPGPARMPSSQGWKRISRNGYEYQFDSDDRTGLVDGTITLNPRQGRSRSSQRQAGGPDRRATDQGGHFIARRFNGPTEAFNHFAQDAKFNNGRYRRLEDKLEKAVRAGRKVSVRIRPEYSGPSLRPQTVEVVYEIDGAMHMEHFVNDSKGN